MPYLSKLRAQAYAKKYRRAHRQEKRAYNRLYWALFCRGRKRVKKEPLKVAA